MNNINPMLRINLGMTNIVRGQYTCSTVNVIDMSGMISRRLVCKPISSAIVSAAGVAPTQAIPQSMF